ncbi:MAG TPA: hypothetical protein VOA78_03635 [Candidatus Dormibacteraeota bacterium]|nr:hypothetical protein [Candidatus Dormibacteraeota bacterium]
MKNLLLATADFVKAASALTDESFHGGVHLAICEGLADMDPFIGNYAPVFFIYTFYGDIYAAQMYANKLFDTHGEAITIPKFLEMARLKASKFKHGAEKVVLAYIAEADNAIKDQLHPTIEALRGRRNKFLAHISPELAFEREKLQKAKAVTMPQIREVLYEGGKIVNGLLLMWNNSANQLRETNRDDYKTVVSIVNKHLCDEANRHEAEFGRHGLSGRVPRPRKCP